MEHALFFKFFVCGRLCTIPVIAIVSFYTVSNAACPGLLHFPGIIFSRLETSQSQELWKFTNVCDSRPSGISTASTIPSPQVSILPTVSRHIKVSTETDRSTSEGLMTTQIQGSYFLPYPTSSSTRFTTKLSQGTIKNTHDSDGHRSWGPLIDKTDITTSSYTNQHSSNSKAIDSIDKYVKSEIYTISQTRLESRTHRKDEMSTIDSSYYKSLTGPDIPILGKTKI